MIDRDTKVEQIDFTKQLCSVCHKRQATKLCDFVVGYQAAPFFHAYLDVESYEPHETCDVALCDMCATSVPDFDFCPAHVKLLAHLDDDLTLAELSSRSKARRKILENEMYHKN